MKGCECFKSWTARNIVNDALRRFGITLPMFCPGYDNFADKRVQTKLIFVFKRGGQTCKIFILNQAKNTIKLVTKSSAPRSEYKFATGIASRKRPKAT